MTDWCAWMIRMTKDRSIYFLQDIQFIVVSHSKSYTLQIVCYLFHLHVNIWCTEQYLQFDFSNRLEHICFTHSPLLCISVHSLIAQVHSTLEQAYTKVCRIINGNSVLNHLSLSERKSWFLYFVVFCSFSFVYQKLKYRCMLHVCIRQCAPLSLLVTLFISI